MEHKDKSIFFYCARSRYAFSLALCLLCAAFAVYVIFKLEEVKWLAYAGLAFFIYKSGVYFYELFFNKTPLVELREKEIIIDGCPALPLKAIDIVGQKRVNVGSSNMLYVCLMTDESKFKLTELQKSNIAMGLTAFCFRPAAMSRRDSEFLIKELLKRTNQKQKV